MSKPRAKPWFFLARQHGLAYLQVPKVACTSVKIALALLNRPELRAALSAKPTEIHSHLDWNDIVPPGNPALGKLFRFTFVRHPLVRFVSFYENKILKPPGGEMHEAMVRAGFTAGMAFEEVLERVERTPVEALDPHIVPQSFIVFEGDKPRAEFIGRMENFGEDLAKVEARTGVKLEIGHHNRSGGGRSEAVGQLTDDHRARLLRLFARDFELLGYSPEP